jgi:WD40 repeat protein
VASGGRTPPEAVIWDVSEGRAQLTLPVPGNYCSGVDWSRDGRSFALASSKELRVYQLGGVEGGGGGKGCNTVFVMPFSQRVVFSPGSSAVASLRRVSDEDEQDVVVVADVVGAAGVVRHELKGHKGRVNCLCWRGGGSGGGGARGGGGKDGGVLVSGGDDGTVRVWDTIKGVAVAKLTGKLYCTYIC